MKRTLLLVSGTALMLLAVGGRWDVALAAWIFPVLLLRFSRTGRAWSAVAGIWAANVAAALFWTWESALGGGPVVIAGTVAIGALRTVPYLLDRWLVRGLPGWAGLLVFPAGVAASEFLLTLVTPFGTAFGVLAVTQYGELPLLQITAVTGSYGIGFLIALAASAANLAWTARRAVRPVAVVAGVMLAVVGLGGVRLAFFSSAQHTVRIAGVGPRPELREAQRAVLGHFPDGRRGIAAAPASTVRPAMRAVQDDLLASTHREAAAGAKIVIWPENAVSAQEADEQAAIDAARAEARRDGVYLEIGVNVYSTTGPAFGKDETLLIDPKGTVLWTYQKAHPIPGSETFKPGDGRVPVVSTPYGRLANVICYDADFPAMMRIRADIVLVPSHDWREYGDAHTRKASLRAIEGGYALFRQDGQGLTSAFDRQGRVLATTDTFAAGEETTVAYVPTRGGTTVYDVIGDTFAWLCVAALAVLTGYALMRRRPGDVVPVPSSGTGGLGARRSESGAAEVSRPGG
ncbi:nitrilase-related carbon-nitrogen hydrolase [Actinomadura rupiterrae]|uniref:nitrilase-related carbon-nitrogen hydrolase n=1 Tax=Actinomadura rupiterrae TaxID=559627 RepID=UPI0020A502B0|nr:nitrilase-related carbon-nitrogen hydrolase [Actinomadura rupiterrae]MCP2343804.1 apolipoprotein N-acyltransferase [Actinomadura rupiterrae]